MQDDVENVALREELARALWRENPINRWAGAQWERALEHERRDFYRTADAILPLIARERAAALSAATPVKRAKA